MNYFYAPKGYKLVGADLSGLELRCLAHYMAKFDDGAYGKEIVEGDIHTRNQKAFRCFTSIMQRHLYMAFLWGAGAAKIGGYCRWLMKRVRNL